MKKITILLIAAVFFSGIFVSCSKKTKVSNEKKVETNFENTKKFNKKVLRPSMKVDLRKLRRSLKKRKGMKSSGKERKQIKSEEKNVLKKDQKDQKVETKAPAKKEKKGEKIMKASEKK